MVISELDFEFYTQEDLVNPPALENKIVALNPFKGYNVHLDDKLLKCMFVDKGTDRNLMPEINEPDFNKTFKWEGYKIGLCSTSFSHQDCVLNFAIQNLIPGNIYRVYLGIAGGASLDRGTGSCWCNHDYIEIISSTNSIKLESSRDNYLRTLPDEKPFVKGKRINAHFPSQYWYYNHGWVWEGKNAPYLEFVASSSSDLIQLKLHTDESYRNESWGYVIGSAKIEKLI